MDVDDGGEDEDGDDGEDDDGGGRFSEALQLLLRLQQEQQEADAISSLFASESSEDLGRSEGEGGTINNNSVRHIQSSICKFVYIRMVWSLYVVCYSIMKENQGSQPQLSS